jgi:hypothetical protein
MAQQSASRFDSPRLGPEGVMTPFDAIVELGRRWAAAPAPIAGGAALAGSGGRHREGGRALQHLPTGQPAARSDTAPTRALAPPSRLRSTWSGTGTPQRRRTRRKRSAGGTQPPSTGILRQG